MASSASASAGDPSGGGVASSGSSSGGDVTVQGQKKQFVEKLEVAAGEKKSVTVNVYPGCYVSWEFSSTHGDIAFSVDFLMPDNSVIHLADAERYACAEAAMQGKVNITQDGTLVLHFDNSYSWFNSKTITATFTVKEPNEIPTEDDTTKHQFQQLPRVVFVLGGPGAGKGTQCEMLAKKFSFLHLSAGDLLRAERNNPNSPDGALITQYIKEGKIVPVEITISLLLKAMRASGRRNFLIDGFPRNHENLAGWNRIVGPHNAEIAGCLFFYCSEKVMEDRLMGRAKESGESVRDDDNIATIRKRFKTFVNETMPVVKVFESRKLVWKINAERSKEEIFEECKSCLSQKFDLQHDQGFIVAKVANTAPLRVILGTMGMSGEGNADDEESRKMIELMIESPAVRAALPLSGGRVELDTARAYGGGKTEELLGRILEQRSKSTGSPLRDLVLIASKANPFPKMGDSLRPESVFSQMNDTLAALRTTKVDIFYLHAPDHSTSIEKTLEACQFLYQKGNFKELGLSNYAAWQVVQIWYICQKNDWVKPTVYQGMYNAITRDVEKELLPALKTYGIRFYAYNPLAGGLLTGSYVNQEEKATSGRFSQTTSLGKIYTERYWKPEYFAAIALFRAACEEAKIPPTEAAFRWLTHHSQLRGSHGDGIILGSRKVVNIQNCLDSLGSDKGPLPIMVVEAFDKGWTLCKPICPSYAR